MCVRREEELRWSLFESIESVSGMETDFRLFRGGCWVDCCDFVFCKSCVGGKSEKWFNGVKHCSENCTSDLNQCIKFNIK